jgi:uncharacterized protein (TIGR02001 family)
MRNFMKLVTVAAIVSMATCGLAFAEDEAPSIGFDVSADFMSKYVWRGLVVNEDYSLQPSITATYGNFSAGAWGQVDMSNEADNEWEFTEVDYWADYTADIAEGVSLSVGIINYHFPSVVGDTTELYWGFGFDLPLSPSITVYHDIDAADGEYVSLGIGHSFENILELTPETSVGLDLSASFGYGDSDYNEFYWGLDDGKANDMLLTAALPFEMCGWTVTPSLNYMKVMSNELKNAGGNATDAFYTGISLSTSF